MARKKILISAPEVKELNDTQWLFELESLYAKEEQRYEEIQVLSDVARRGLVSILGLNLMPIEEEVAVEARDEEYEGAIGEDRIFTKLRHPEDHEFLPLSILMGREEIIAEIVKRQQELHDQEELDNKEASGENVQMTPEELDAFMDDGLDGGDMMFVDSPSDFEKKMIWESEETQKINAALVKPFSEKDNDIFLMDEAAFKEPPKVSKKKSKVTLE